MKRFIRTLTVITALIIISGCQEQLFTEYDGQSFVARGMISAPDNWELMPDYTFETGTNALDYMDFYEFSANGGPSNAPIYVLEIKNLLLNGDFEDGTNSTNPWSTTGTALLNNYTGVNQIDSNTTYFETAASERVYAQLPTDLVNASTYISGKNYVFGYSYRTASVIRMFFEPDWAGGTNYDIYDYLAYGGTNGSQSNVGITNLNVYPPLDAALADANGPNVFTAQNTALDDAFSFTSDSPVKAYFDNFTIVRDSEGDFDMRLKLKLDLDHRSDLKLISGYYRFFHLCQRGHHSSCCQQISLRQG